MRFGRLCLVEGCCLFVVVLFIVVVFSCCVVYMCDSCFGWFVFSLFPQRYKRYTYIVAFVFNLVVLC